MALFRNHLHDEFGSWPLAYIPYGGADYGEIAAVGAAVARATSVVGTMSLACGGSSACVPAQAGTETSAVSRARKIIRLCMAQLLRSLARMAAMPKQLRRLWLWLSV